MSIFYRSIPYTCGTTQPTQPRPKKRKKNETRVQWKSASMQYNTIITVWRYRSTRKYVHQTISPSSSKNGHIQRVEKKKTQKLPSTKKVDPLVCQSSHFPNKFRVNTPIVTHCHRWPKWRISKFNPQRRSGHLETLNTSEFGNPVDSQRSWRNYH